MEVEHDGDGAAAELEERGVGPLASRARFPLRVESERGTVEVAERGAAEVAARGRRDRGATHA